MQLLLHIFMINSLLIDTQPFRQLNFRQKKAILYASPLPDLSQSTFPDIPENGYDIIILGSGPGGQSLAVLASQLGASVAVVEKRSSFGGPTGNS